MMAVQPVGEGALLDAVERARHDPSVQRALSADEQLLGGLVDLATDQTKPAHAAAVRLLTALGQTPSRAVRPAAAAGGVRVLSLDGGGTRALLTIEMLKEVERLTGKRIHELFDVIGAAHAHALSTWA